MKSVLTNLLSAAAIVLVSTACASPRPSPLASASAQATSAPAQVTSAVSQPAAAIDMDGLQKTHVLAWSQPQKEFGFGHMDRVFPVRTIKKGPAVMELPRSESPLSITYEVDGEQWSLDDYVAHNQAAGLLVIVDGTIVYEKYGLGHSASGRWTSFSVAKSLTSTLVGAAIKDGKIASVSDPLTRYLPALKGSGYDGVTVEQALTMTSGVRWNEDYTDPKSDVSTFLTEPSKNGSDPTVTYMARLARASEPGSVWQYKTGESNLIGSLVEAATGQHLADYLAEKIWSRIGMEQDAEWILNSGGREIAGCCISATLRDFGRFGVFFMNGAQVDSVSIVPSDWIQRATQSAPPALAAMEDVGYGYQWWTAPGPAYWAVGIFGQGIWINPDLKLVVVTQGAWTNAVDAVSSGRRKKMIAAVERFVTERRNAN